MTLNPNTSLAFNESKRKISGILNRKGKPIQQTEAPVSTTSYGSRNISPQRCLGPNSWNLVICYIQFSSVQFSRSVVSNSLRHHELQHARPPCRSPTLGVYSNSCPLSRWCHPGISSSVVPFSSCPQSLPASRSFPMSQLCTWGGQSIGV